MQLCKEVSKPINPYAFVFTQLSDLNSFMIQRANYRQTQYLRRFKQQQQSLEDEQGGMQAASGAAGGQSSSSGSQLAEIEARFCPDDQGQAGKDEEGYSDAALASQLDDRLRSLDGYINDVFASLPANTLLMVVTGAGDTAECRRQQEVKFKRQGRVDGLPMWTLKDEESYVDLLNREIQGLCFCHIKQA